MSPPPPGIPGASARFTEDSPGVRSQLNSINIRQGQTEARLGAVEGHCAQLVKDVGSIKEATARFAGYEATAKSWLARGVLLIMGSIGGTYGVTRATVPDQQPARTEIIKSATTVKVEACTAMQPGPDRDQCAIRILTDLMGHR